jgi:hypothetical protein
MQVYHFLSATWALDDIRKKRIKISVIDQLNDPFELWCVEQRDERFRQALRGFKAEMGERFGVICFSRRWHNPLLWNHHGDKHRVMAASLPGRIPCPRRPRLKRF